MSDDDDVFKDAVIQKLDALTAFLNVTMRAQATIMRMIVKDSGGLSPDKKKELLESIEKFDKAVSGKSSTDTPLSK
jgi:hypothetical protein